MQRLKKQILYLSIFFLVVFDLAFPAGRVSAQNVLLNNESNTSNSSSATSNGQVWETISGSTTLFNGADYDIGAEVWGGPTQGNLTLMGTFTPLTDPKGYTGYDVGQFTLGDEGLAVDVPGVSTGAMAWIEIKAWDYDSPHATGTFSTYNNAVSGSDPHATVLFQNPTSNNSPPVGAQSFIDMPALVLSPASGSSNPESFSSGPTATSSVTWGQTITFGGTGTGAPSTKYDAYFCKNSSDTPPCTLDNFCSVTSGISNGSPISGCTYVAQSTDASSTTAYGFICDHGSTSSTSCSSASSVSATINPEIYISGAPNPYGSQYALAGSVINFSAYAITQSSTYRLLVCGYGSTATHGSTPSCSGTQYCLSTGTTNSGSQAACSYTVGTSSFTAIYYVCDVNYCSVSPPSVGFTVNAAPTISISANPVRLKTGGGITFSGTVGEVTGGNVTFIICKTNDYYEGTCTSGDSICSYSYSSFPASPSCPYTTTTSDCASSSNCSKTFYTNADNGHNPVVTTPINFAIRNTPPAQSSWSPAKNATIITSSPNISFSLDEDGDCKASTTSESYANMSSGANYTVCKGANTNSISCQMPALATDPANTSVAVYVACEDALGNADSTPTTLNYTIVTNQSHTKWLAGVLKFFGSLLWK